MYTIGQITKLTGLSKDKLRYYEEKGILAPSYDADNRYRKYSYYDLLKILTIEHYRHLDLSTKEILAIHEGADLQNIYEVMENKKAEVQRQMTVLEEQLRGIQEIQERIERIESQLNLITIRPFGPYKWLSHTTELNLKDRTAWKEQSLPNLKNGSILESLVREIKFDKNGYLEKGIRMMAPVLPNDEDAESVVTFDQCVYAVIEDGIEGAGTEQELFEKVKNWMAEQQVQPLGIAYLKMLLLIPDAQNSKSYLELYVPFSR